MATDARHSLLLHSVKLDTPYTDDTGERTREHIDEMQHSKMGLGEAGWGGVGTWRKRLRGATLCSVERDTPACAAAEKEQGRNPNSRRKLQAMMISCASPQ